MYAYRHVRTGPERSYLCRHCGRVVWSPSPPAGYCPCCMRGDGWALPRPGALDFRASRPHGSHDHIWPDAAAALSIRPRRGFVFQCQTCGDLSLVSKGAHCLGRQRMTVRRRRVILRLGADGRLGYSFEGGAGA